MKRSAITGTAAIAAAVAIMLSGCGSDTKTEPSTSTTASKTTPTTSAKAAPSSKPKVAPRDEDAKGAASDDRELHRGEQHPGDSHQDG